MMRAGLGPTMAVRWFVGAGITVLAVALELTFASPLVGPGRNVGAGVYTDRVLIAGQLRAAVRLGRLAVEQLGGPQATEHFPESFRLIQEMYAQVRLAVTGMYWARQYTKFPDALLDYQSRRTNEAWVRIRGVADRHIRGESPVISAEQIPTAISDLNSAIAILEQVVELLP